MDAFAYLSVLISIIIGLAITQILQGFRGLMLARSRLRPYWPSIVWAVLLLLISVQVWWAMYDLRWYRDWSFFGFAVVLAETVPLYLLAGLVFPDVAHAADTDLRAHYFGNHRWFFVLAMLLIVTSLLKTAVLYGHLPSPLDTGYQALFLVTAALAAWTRREWFHKLVALTSVAIFTTYIAVLFAHLP